MYKKIKKSTLALTLLSLLGASFTLKYTLEKKYPKKNIIIIAPSSFYGIHPITIDNTHQRYNIYYIVPAHAISSPIDNLENSQGWIPVQKINKFTEVDLAIQKLKKKYHIKTIHRILPFVTEQGVLLASKLRRKYKVPGMKPKVATYYVDKLAMKKALASHGAPIIPYTEKIEDAPQQLGGYPLVLKPTTSDASRGIYIIKNKNEFQKALTEIKTQKDQHYIAEPYIQGTIFQVDGLVQNGHIIFSIHHRLIGTCYDYYRNNKPKASIPVKDPNTIQTLQKLAQACITLGYQNGPFHLEVLQKHQTKEFFIMEVAARATGSSIPEALHRATGFDFRKTAIQIAMGDNITIPQKKIDALYIGTIDYPITLEDPSTQQPYTKIASVSPISILNQYQCLTGYFVLNTWKRHNPSHLTDWPTIQHNYYPIKTYHYRISFLFFSPSHHELIQEIKDFLSKFELKATPLPKEKNQEKP